MRAVVQSKFGPPENLEVVEMDDPTPGEGELLVEVAACPITFPDLLQLEDKYQFKVDPPYVPGNEVAGVVTAVGAAVEGFAVGDRVQAGLNGTGGFAELAVAKAKSARKLPESIGFAESTGLQYAHGTTYYGLKWRGELKEGETLLITGAGGAVGMSAVELGKLMGARVIAAASTEEKLDLCRERGADETINYSNEDLKVRAKELTDGKGVDVVYDCVGGDLAEQCVRAMAWGGRFLVIGFAAGIPSIPLNLTLLKSCSIVGVFYGAMTAKEPQIAEQVHGDLWDWTASGRLKPHVSERYALADATVAMRQLMDRKAVGKVVLEPNS